MMLVLVVDNLHPQPILQSPCKRNQFGIMDVKDIGFDLSDLALGRDLTKESFPLGSAPRPERHVADVFEVRPVNVLCEEPDVISGLRE
jgi:hypothetical protein